ncbi:MAG: hypothetical protein WC867_01430 [Candidatus Pacearchaeota archaeon]|jgi:hypothetical protein
MFENVTYYMILGKPLSFYLGILTFIFMISAALIPFFQKKGVKWASYTLHVRLAIIAVMLGIIHGGLLILANL